MYAIIKFFISSSRRSKAAAVNIRTMDKLTKLTKVNFKPNRNCVRKLPIKRIRNNTNLILPFLLAGVIKLMKSLEY